MSDEKIGWSSIPAAVLERMLRIIFTAIMILVAYGLLCPRSIKFSSTQDGFVVVIFDRETNTEYIAVPFCGIVKREKKTP